MEPIQRAENLRAHEANLFYNHMPYAIERALTIKHKELFLSSIPFPTVDIQRKHPILNEPTASIASHQGQIRLLQAVRTLNDGNYERAGKEVWSEVVMLQYAEYKDRFGNTRLIRNMNLLAPVDGTLISYTVTSHHPQTGIGAHWVEDMSGFVVFSKPTPINYATFAVPELQTRAGLINAVNFLPNLEGNVHPGTIMTKGPGDGVGLSGGFSHRRTVAEMMHVASHTLDLINGEADLSMDGGFWLDKDHKYIYRDF